MPADDGCPELVARIRKMIKGLDDKEEATKSDLLPARVQPLSA
jgi:hypothetical protein